MMKKNVKKVSSENTPTSGFITKQSGEALPTGQHKKMASGFKKPCLVREKGVSEQITDETTLNPKRREITLMQLQKVSIRNLPEECAVELVRLGFVFT